MEISEKQRFIENTASDLIRSNTTDIKIIRDGVERDLKTYKTVHYRLYGKKPQWYSMRDIKVIINEVIDEVNCRKNCDDLGHG